MSVAVSTIDAMTELAERLKSTMLYGLSLTTAGAPDLEYLSAATPVYDCCPFLAVHVGNLSEESTSPLSPAPAAGHRGALGRINLVQYVVTAVRCAANPDKNGNVLVSEKNAVAAQVQQDAWGMWNALIWAVRNGTFVDLCSDIHFDRGTSIPEQGGCVGWTMVIRVELGGMPNPGPFS